MASSFGDNDDHVNDKGKDTDMTSMTLSNDGGDFGSKTFAHAWAHAHELEGRRANITHYGQTMLILDRAALGALIRDLTETLTSIRSLLNDNRFELNIPLDDARKAVSKLQSDVDRRLRVLKDTSQYGTCYDKVYYYGKNNIDKRYPIHHTDKEKESTTTTTTTTTMSLATPEFEWFYTFSDMCKSYMIAFCMLHITPNWKILYEIAPPPHRHLLHRRGRHHRRHHQYRRSLSHNDAYLTNIMIDPITIGDQKDKDADTFDTMTMTIDKETPTMEINSSSSSRQKRPPISLPHPLHKSSSMPSSSISSPKKRPSPRKMMESLKDCVVSAIRPSSSSYSLKSDNDINEKKDDDSAHSIHFIKNDRMLDKFKHGGDYRVDFIDRLSDLYVLVEIAKRRWKDIQKTFMIPENVNSMSKAFLLRNEMMEVYKWTFFDNNPLLPIQNGETFMTMYH